MKCFALQYSAARRTFHLILLVFLLGSFSIAAAEAGAAESATVSFLPQWQPQAQFAGYYVAHDKGFYRKRGLDVKILRGGPERPSSEMLAQGRTDFATLQLSGAIVRRARGVKLVNICQMGQRSALMLVAKKSSGINTPQDLQGKKVGVWGEDFRGQLRAFFHKYGLTVKTVPQGATLNLFLRGGVEVASAMWYNEYHLILNAGLNPEELTTFSLADHGLNFPEDGVYCLEQTYKDKPGWCRKFVQGSIAGWQYAFAHPEEALDIVMKYVEAAHVPSDRVHQKWMLARMRDLILPHGGERPACTLSREDYQQVAESLKDAGIIQEIPDFPQFYFNCANDDAN